MHLAIKGPVRGKKQIASKLHGESGRSLHFSAGFDIAIRRADDTPDVDARVAVEIFVFDRDQRIAEDFWIIIVGRNDAALKRKGADDSALAIIKFRDRARTITLEFIDLR